MFPSTISHPRDENDHRRTPIPQLVRRSRVSWEIDPGEIDDLASLLRSQGFQDLEAKPREAHRLRHPCGSLVILYRTGTVLVQGRAMARALRYFTRLEQLGRREEVIA